MIEIIKAQVIGGSTWEVGSIVNNNGAYVKDITIDNNRVLIGLSSLTQIDIPLSLVILTRSVRDDNEPEVQPQEETQAPTNDTEPDYTKAVNVEINEV